MSELTGGELLARALANEGVKFVFGLPCPEIDPLLAALDANGIRFVTIRHEAAAVHMAEGLYKTTGKVAVVLGNPGPGTANLVPGLLTARHEGVPVLAITSQHRAGVVYPSTPATFQGQDQLDLIKPVVKWNGPVFEWTRIPELVRMAFREMWAGRPGPVHLEIPGPVLYATGDPATAPIHPAESASLLAAAAVRGAARGGRRAAREREDTRDLRRHRRRSRPGERGSHRARRTARVPGDPVDGGTCRHAARSPAVLPFPESGGRRAAPQRGRDAGRRFARRQSRRALRQVLGRPREVPGHPRRRGPAAHRRVPSRRDRHGRRCPHGSRRTGREAQGRKLASLGRADVAAQRAVFGAWAKAIGDSVVAWKGPGIHPAQAIGAVGAVFGPGAVYCTDGGMTSLWAGIALPSTQPNSYHGILEFGMLGTGIPSSIGAKLGAPARDVVCVTGDGAAGFNAMEMQVAAREGVKVTCVVMAEAEWTMEIPNEMARWGKTFGTGMGEVRWDKVAEGLGCHGEYVDSIEALPAALARAKAHAGPALVCVRTSKEANLSVPESGIARFFEVYFGPSA